MKLEIVARPDSRLPPRLSLVEMVGQLRGTLDTQDAVRLVPNGVKPDPIRVALLYWARCEGLRLRTRRGADGWSFWLEHREERRP